MEWIKVAQYTLYSLIFSIMAIIRSATHQKYITFLIEENEAGEWTASQPTTNHGYLIAEGAVDAIIKACKIDKKEWHGHDREKVNEDWRRQGQDERRESERVERAEKRPQKVSECFIYLIRDIPRGLYKIGKAVNVANRFGQLKTANADIELITAYKGCDKDETNLHRMFETRRVSREWFMLEGAHLDAIRGYFELMYSVKTA